MEFSHSTACNSHIAVLSVRVVVSQCCEEATTTKERSTTNEPKVYSLSVRKKRWAQLRQLDVST